MTGKEGQDKIRDAGGLQQLISLLCPTEHTFIKEAALFAVGHVIKNNAEAKAEAINSNLLADIIHLLVRALTTYIIYL